MDVFYVDRMGRSPDRYDYLWYACKAVSFAEQQVDPELRAFAERKATQYHLRWASGHTNGLPDYWTRQSDTAKYMSKDLTEFLGSHPKHAYKQDIQQAIQDLQEAEKKGIISPSTATE